MKMMYESQHYVLQIGEMHPAYVASPQGLARITMKREFGRERVKARQFIMLAEANPEKIDQRLKDSILAISRPFDDTYVAERDLREKRLDMVEVILTRDTDYFSVDLRIGFVESIPYFTGADKYSLVTARQGSFMPRFPQRFEDFSEAHTNTFSSQFGVKPEIVNEIVDLEKRLKQDLPDFRKKYLNNPPSLGEVARYMDELGPLGVKVIGYFHSAGNNPLDILVGSLDGEQVYFARRNGDTEFAECSPKALLESQIRDILSIMKRHDTELIGIKRG